MNAESTTAQTQNPRAEGRWRLDPSASTAEFQVPHFWGLVTVKGHFDRLDGSLDLEGGRRPARAVLGRAEHRDRQHAENRNTHREAL